MCVFIFIPKLHKPPQRDFEKCVKRAQITSTDYIWKTGMHYINTIRRQKSMQHKLNEYTADKMIH